tara:strand:+ start:3388 stop:3561 length:174 start_codon:yes stop_codon:yes gene_type:complete
VYKEVFVRGYYRSGNIFVSPHIRKIKIKGYRGNKGGIKSYSSVDRNQLTFNFSGKTI